MVHAQVEARPYRGNAVGCVRIERRLASDRPAAESDWRDMETRVAQRTANEI
jgi:hypothetical protein